MSVSVQIGVVPVEINAQVYVLQLQTKKSFQSALVTRSRLSEEAQNIWNTIGNLEYRCTSRKTANVI